jgi:chorismate dehydratase
MMRIGCVPYLNARPLLEGLAAELAVPSALADQFTQGRYQAALLPVFETLRLPAPRIADGYGICSLGPVQSVIVAHRNPLSQTEEILLDPASRSSVNLLRILLKSYLKIAPRLVTTSNDPLAARLLIGDPALAFQRQRDPQWQIFDLGAAWTAWTGLPFVFAVWTLSPTAPETLPEILRSAARAGLAALPRIAAAEPDPAAALHYLTRAIHHSIGPREKLAISEFRRLLIASSLLPPDAAVPTFV